jgi:hypothetical protein
LVYFVHTVTRKLSVSFVHFRAPLQHLLNRYFEYSDARYYFSLIPLEAVAKTSSAFENQL